MSIVLEEFFPSPFTKLTVDVVPVDLPVEVPVEVPVVVPVVDPVVVPLVAPVESVVVVLVLPHNPEGRTAM